MKEVNGLNDIKMVFIVRKDLNMRKGKLAAQVAHGCLNSFIEQTKQFDGNLAMMKELQFLRGVTERLILLPSILRLLISLCSKMNH